MQILQPTPKRSLRKRGSHTQAGSEQLNPFGRSLRGAVATKTHEPKQTSKKQKQNGLNHVAVLDYFFAVPLALSQKSTIQLNCTSRSNIQDPKIFLQKTFFHKPKTGNNDTAVAFAPLRRPAPIMSSHMMTGAWSVVIIEGHRQPPSRC